MVKKTAKAPGNPLRLRVREVEKRRLTTSEGDNVKTMAAAAMMAMVMGTAGPVLADSDSLITLGLGQSLGVSHVKPVSGGTANNVVTEFNMRLRMLAVLGVDFNYNMSGEQTVGHGESYSSNYRLSALLYLVPTSVMSLYLSAGAGASELSSLTESDLLNKSYHGGGGLEVYIGSHMSLAAEFLMLIPEVEQIVVSQQALRVDASARPTGASLVDAPEVSDYITPENFQLSLGLKYYF
jgi:hypothetical protein